MIRVDESDDNLKRERRNLSPARVLFQCALLVTAMIVGVGGSLAVAGESSADAWRRFEELWSAVPSMVGFPDEAESASRMPTEPWVHVFVQGVLKQKGLQMQIVGEQYETRLAVDQGTDVSVERSVTPSMLSAGSTTR